MSDWGGWIGDAQHIAELHAQIEHYQDARQYSAEAFAAEKARTARNFPIAPSAPKAPPAPAAPPPPPTCAPSGVYPPLVLKDKDGDRLLKKFSQPRKPSKKDPRTRIKPEEDPVDAARLYAYNLTDIESEASISVRIPDQQPRELEFWMAHERINRRGVQCDTVAVENAIAIIEQGYAKYNAQMSALTGGQVTEVTQIQALLRWINLHRPGCAPLESLDDDAITETLKEPHLQYFPNALQALQLRQMAGLASVKKLYALRAQTTPYGRIHDLFVYHSARTGRSAGSGPQPQNLPKSGPDVRHCEDATCGNYYAPHHSRCPHCGADSQFSSIEEWSARSASAAIRHMEHRSLDYFEWVWRDAFAAISGCLRGMFIAGPGKDFLCADFNAIEAVVLAALAGEEWRMEVFRTHGKIYEMSASKITGIPFDEYAEYRKRTGQHHPTRGKIGKVAELACLRRDSLVLTKDGWKPIWRIKPQHQIWDGEAWVYSGGAVKRPQQARYVLLDGLYITGDHLVLVEGDKWAPAAHLETDRTGRFIAHYTATMQRPTDMQDAPHTYPERRNDGEVWDILECGPRNRFMVKTEHSVLVVHNSGYQGWVNAWKNFGADEHFANDDEIKEKILAWRDASPNIVALWKGLEDAAIGAIRNPGHRFKYRQLEFYVHNDVMYMVLPSGRHLAYHKPRLGMSDRGKPQITYWTWNTNPKYGAVGWIEMQTFGGRLTENAVQAVSGDLLREAILRVEAAGYPVVLHVHDEVVAEVDEGWGSIEEFEGLMVQLPHWAMGWPVRASGGWRAKRYSK